MGDWLWDALIIAGLGLALTGLYLAVRLGGPAVTSWIEWRSVRRSMRRR